MSVLRFAVFALADGALERATPWYYSRRVAEQHADLRTDLGLDGQPVGRMAVWIDGHVYVDLSPEQHADIDQVTRIELPGAST